MGKRDDVLCHSGSMRTDSFHLSLLQFISLVSRDLCGVEAREETKKNEDAEDVGLSGIVSPHGFHLCPS